jgi:hypothetical protein
VVEDPSTTQPTIRTSPPSRATSSGLRASSTWVDVDRNVPCAHAAHMGREVAGEHSQYLVTRPVTVQFVDEPAPHHYRR